jgi:hypothetical protein
MNIRRIAAAVTFATGAALAFAPLASADLGDTVTSTLDSEISSQNSLFELQALFAGVTDVTKGGVGVYDSVPLTDVPHALTYGAVTPLETELYGANPIVAGISSGISGPFNEYNGALTEFYNAYNVGVFAAANNNALDTNPANYLGSQTTDAAVLGAPNATVTSAEQAFFNLGLGDLKGFDAIFAPTASGPGDLDPTIGNEIVQLNQLFELDGRLANVFGDIAPHGSNVFGVGFDTINPLDTNTAFDSLVFGAAGPSLDPGSYDVLNGALGEFFNASNVGLFSLLNGGAILPDADLIGTHFDFLDGTVSAAITDFLNQGFSDLAGYFVPAAMAGM